MASTPERSEKARKKTKRTKKTKKDPGVAAGVLSYASTTKAWR
jgi:hypothetical protein